jgi:hypothetical protein
MVPYPLHQPRPKLQHNIHRLSVATDQAVRLGVDRRASELAAAERGGQGDLKVTQFGGVMRAALQFDATPEQRDGLGRYVR